MSRFKFKLGDWVTDDQFGYCNGGTIYRRERSEDARGTRNKYYVAGGLNNYWQWEENLFSQEQRSEVLEYSRSKGAIRSI